MPIKNLSEDVRLPRLGKIKLGYRHPEKGYPVKTDYFVLPEAHSDYKKLVDAFGAQPKELRVLIPAEDEETWASQYYKSYSQSRGLVCKGDGDHALRMVDAKTNELPTRETGAVAFKDVECRGKECPIYKAKNCGEVMNLRFILPEVPGLGVWQIDTGSINSILNINSCARLIKKAFGRISFIPLKLTLEEIQVNNPEDGKKQAAYVLNLRSMVTIAQLAETAREQAKTLMLEAPDLEAVYDEQVDNTIDALWGKVETKAPPGETIPPKSEAKPAAAETKAPVKETPKANDSPGKEELLKLEFRNPGELKQAALNHLGIQGSQVDKDVPEYNLLVPGQRKQAWLILVGLYAERPPVEVK